MEPLTDGGTTATDTPDAAAATGRRRLRPAVLGVGSLAIAAGAVLFGANISAGAMPPEAPTNAESVTIGTLDVGADGRPVGYQCTFTGADAARVAPPAGDVQSMGVAEPVEGAIAVTGVAGADGVTGPTATAPGADQPLEASGNAAVAQPVPAGEAIELEAVPGDPGIDGPELDAMRTGSAEECSALLKDITQTLGT